MPADRSSHPARLIERPGADVAPIDAGARRIGRARRVQDAWLRGLGGTTPAARPQPPGPAGRER